MRLNNTEPKHLRTLTSKLRTCSYGLGVSVPPQKLIKSAIKKVITNSIHLKIKVKQKATK